MCEFCCDDESDIEVHRASIRAWEERAEWARREAKNADWQVQIERMRLQHLLRKQRIRNA